MHKRFDELKSTGQLPSPTGVAMKILRLAEQEDVNLEELVRVIKGDPAMAGRLLQLSNSAYYASDRPITAVGEAVARLGLNVVWKAALGFSVISSHRRGSCRHFKYNEFWANSLAIAVSAQAVSRNISLANPEEAFVCGLLSQIGRLALACLYPEAYDRLLVAAAGKTGQAIVDLEQKAFAMDHRELTAAMLADWGIAAGWIQAVRDHEDPDQTELPKNHENLKLAWLLHVAAQMGNMYIADPEAYRPTMQDLLGQAESLGVSHEQVAGLCDESAREWNNWGKVLGIQTQTLPSFSILVQEIHQTAHDIDDMKDSHKQSNASHDAHHPGDGPFPNLSTETAEIRLLVVSEEHGTLEIFRENLPAGNRVVCANDNQAALQTALEFDPQIIVTDWEAHGIDGLALCRALRKTKTGQQVYILILAEKQEDEALASALAAGANEYLRKPLNPGIVESRMSVALRIVRLQQELLSEQEQIRQNLAQLAVLNRTLERDALTDPLTGLPNRRYALARLSQEWASSVRSHSPLCCLFLDLDHFKTVNDTHGHEAGDYILAETALVLKRALRASDVVCRIGGEEFLVICRDTNLAQGMSCAERLRRSVEEYRYCYSGMQVRITISIGIAERTSAMTDSEELVKHADHATYESKAAGRNRFTVACT